MWLNLAVEETVPILAIPSGSVITGTTVLSGTGAPGGSVRVLVDGKEATRAEVDASGVWTMTVPSLPAGDHQVQVETLDDAGEVIAKSAPVAVTAVSVGKPTPMPTKPPVATPTVTPTETATRVLASTLPGGAAAVPTSILPGGAVAAEETVPILAIPSGGVITGATVLSGTGAPGGSVRVLVDGKEATRAEVDVSGVWTMTVPSLPAGDHQVQVEALDDAGEVIAKSAPVAVTVMAVGKPTPMPTKPPAATPTVTPTETATRVPASALPGGAAAVPTSILPGGAVAVPATSVAAGMQGTEMTPAAEPPSYLPTTGRTVDGDAGVVGLPVIILILSAVAAMLTRRKKMERG